MEFIFSSANLPFAIALAVMFGIAFLEGITALFGVGFSSFLETILPELEVDADTPASGESVDTSNTMTRLLGWLQVGKVPLLMLLIIFLTAFGLIGLSIQSMLHSTLGFMLPSWLAVIPAFVMSLPVVNIAGGVLANLMPQDETEAVSSSSFIGQVAVITLGSASTGNPAQAKLKDRYGQTHYVMLAPDEDNESFHAGDSVLIVKKQGSVFAAIRNTNPGMIDD